jgi:hypothetical protein
MSTPDETALAADRIRWVLGLEPEAAQLSPQPPAADI